jgi:TPP-dependent 2-oxoacid decarboxylase
MAVMTSDADTVALLVAVHGDRYGYRELKDYVYRRFHEVLGGEDKSETFAHLSEEDRKAILEILHDTKPDF